jgi:hypothetical protein
MAVMKPSPPLISKAQTDAFAASGLAWLGWLLAVILKLGAPRKSRTLRRFVEKLERFVEHTIFLMAVQRLALPRRRRRPTPPCSIAAGFRRAMRRPRSLFKLGRIRARGKSLHKRVLRLISALANPAPYVERFLRRLRRGPSAFTIIAAAPPAVACASLAPPELRFLDDS